MSENTMKCKIRYWKDAEGVEELEFSDERGFLELPMELIGNDNGELIKEMYLKCNALKTLPTWIVNMKNLTNLYLFGNQIKYLPEEIGELKYLEILDLQNNLLEMLPHSITKLKNLNFLNLQCNNLSFLPGDIGNLKALYVLNLKGNGIQHLPPSICNLHSLQELNLDCNHISSLPQNIVYLPNLSYISVNGNELKFLPSIWFLSNPMYFFSHNPSLNYLPYEIGCALTRKCDLMIEGSFWHINISGCCNEPKDEISQFLMVLHVPVCQQNIVLPPTLRRVAQCNQRFIPSLYELTLRKMYCTLFSVSDMRQCTFNEILEQMPQDIQSALWLGPTSLCHSCRCPIFTECVLWVIPRFMLDDANGQMPNHILATIYFCSRTCSINLARGEIIHNSNEKFHQKILEWYCIVK